MSRDEILERLWSGEVDLEAPEVKAAAAKDPEVRDAVARLRATAAHLRTLGKERAAVLAEAATLRGVSGERTVTDVARRRRRQTRVRTLGLWLAAAAVLGIALTWRTWSTPSATGDGELGPGARVAADAAAPQGVVDRYGEFTWRFGSPGCEYVVTVFDGQGRKIGDSGRIHTQTWTPTFDLPTEIEWQVDVKTPDPQNDPEPYEMRARLR
ncbi:MAG: hypothetical protein R3F56_07090 [Planctomycetota bacterium]